MNSIREEFLKYGLVFDRTVNDRFNLPYSYDQIEIQPNDLAVASTINTKLRKLYYNLLYLYGICNIANYDIPKTFTGWVGVTGSDATPSAQFKVQKYSSNYPLSTAVSFVSGGTFISKINNSTIADTFPSLKEQLPVIISANTNTLTILVFDREFNVFNISGKPIILNQSLIDPLSGTLTYKNITGLAVNPKEEVIYVADQNLSNIYAYDITDTITSDPLHSGKLFLSDFIGGRGTAFDNTKFNLLNKIAFSGEVLFAEDAGNRCIKAYDKDLNWLNTSILKNLYRGFDRLNTLTYNRQDNQLYGCTDKMLYVLNIDSNFNVTSGSSYDYSSIILNNDRIVDLKFSNYDPRVFYILTKNSLIKKWTTKLDSSIGIYSNAKLNFNDFKWICTTPLLSSDNILLYNSATNLSSSNIAVFEDELDLISLLKDTVFTVYNENDVSVDREEYNQAWVYNKSFKKLLYNIIRLTSNIGYKFFEGKTDTRLNTYVTRKYNTYFLSDSALNVNTFSNICINENFQSGVVNRCLKKIYDYQYQILTSIVNQDNINNNLLPRSIKSNNLMFNYTIYYQGNGISMNPNGFKMYSNTDSFASLLGDIDVVSLAPYSSGGGIIII